ncbi:YmaF family protein [Clostridium puniceum]|uniref:YmaF family protein n=1 Tax=Clostridium puniceum TaxID=29367 RepID=A0A1S8THV0_9CLOT|nr:YmaF family protein [Clostridium puniceum]OOM77380.1 YmaF family protein [Clostridium puniceum]
MGYNYDKCSRYSKENDEYEEHHYKVKNHNHEFESSTDYFEGVVHNHRIAGVTGPPIEYGKSHVHKIAVLTDTFGDHFHKICDTTGPALFLPGGKHIHLVKGETTFDAGHDHDYYFATLIEDPTNVPKDKKC